MTLIYEYLFNITNINDAQAPIIQIRALNYY